MATGSARRLGADALGEKSEVRAFFGLPLPDTHREALAPYIAACAAVGPDFRWTPAPNLHLTLRFLGRVDLPLAEGIADGVAESDPGGFDVRLGELGVFKRGRLARVVWLGVVAGGQEMASLATLLESECVRAGLEPEGRRFNAHLTLARARQRDGAAVPALPAAPELPAWRARELVLFRSRLGRAGSVYEPLRAISLR
ncbi:MAG TPA: RNA 2',3'-cyclic phosphodiesterase [Candidatus Dormibacteraeota bacterium]|nr:RNA 2',3'-cyclic phosphodiesterase [Candidatus Dormibacteraeota bacterium]